MGDTNHDGIFVDHVLRDLIISDNFFNEDLGVQSDNAYLQYKNKHSFGPLQSLADEFSLRIIRTYGPAHHCKGAIDAMSSFGVKNILRKDMVTHDVFFNNSSDMVQYLSAKNPRYYCSTIPVKSLVLAPQNVGNLIKLPSCMKQYLIIFRPKEKIFCKDYFCYCNSCLQFNFKNCTNEDAVHYDDKDEENDLNCEEEIDEEIDQFQQVFEFITAPPFVSLCSGTTVEPLYFVQITGKDVAEDAFLILMVTLLPRAKSTYKGLYLKLVPSRNSKIKPFSTLSTRIIIGPDEIYDNYVDFNDLELDIDIYKMLIRKQVVKILILFAIWSYKFCNTL